jgi:hypothetical protein
MIENGDFIALGLLARGDVVRVTTGRGDAGKGAKPVYRYKVTRYHPHQVRDSNKREKFKVPLHRLTVEAELNGLTLDAYLQVLRSDQDAAATLTYLSPEVHVHHEDHDTLNNDPANLVVLEASEHHRHHAHEGGGDHVLWQIGNEHIASIETHGDEPTYDVEVTDDPHNFLANGFVVHNTGKTTLLRMMAEATNRRGQYVAFNRAITEQAQREFPPRCSARTMHSLAHRAVVDAEMARRLRAPRIRSDLTARILGVGPLTVSFGEQAKVLQPGFLASRVMRAIDAFCDSGESRPSAHHVPYVEGIDLPKPDGTRTYDNNERVRAHLEPHLRSAWADLNRRDGRLPFRHGHYLKMWELGGPVVDADYLVVDEAQDVNPVMASVIEQQADRCQVVAVGDSAQAIYGWRGAVDYLDTLDADAVLYLSQSWRFGPDIAAAANAVLAEIDSPLRLSGLPSVASRLEELPDARAVLTRSNAVAVKELFAAQASGRAAYLVGGGDEVRAFVKGAIDLRDKGRSAHHDLACFTSWDEVVSYVAFDAQGDDLALLVKLIDEYGADEIDAALRAMPGDEAGAEVVISTAHKAKGREWETVRLTDDFRYRGGPDSEGPRSLPDEEWRLLYVAMTRARLGLDVTACEPLCDLLGLDPAEAL